MKTILIATAAAVLLTSTPALAKNSKDKSILDDLNYGAGIGFIDLGPTSSATLFYAIAEKDLDKVRLAKGWDSVAQIRLGTSTAASQSIFFLTTEAKVDYIVSGLFKASKQVDKKIAVYGMAGASYSSVTVTTTSPQQVILGIPVPGTGGSSSASSTGIDINLAVGADFQVNRDFKVGAEYAKYGIGDAFAVNAYYNF